MVCPLLFVMSPIVCQENRGLSPIVFWHWAVFVREGTKQYVLDSKKALKSNIRTDFGRMKPKWHIKVNA